MAHRDVLYDAMRCALDAPPRNIAAPEKFSARLAVINQSLVGVVMGRHAGFLTAASALGRKFADDGPHLICLPERTFDMQQFLRGRGRQDSRDGRRVYCRQRHRRDRGFQDIFAPAAGLWHAGCVQAAAASGEKSAGCLKAWLREVADNGLNLVTSEIVFASLFRSGHPL